MMRTPGLAPSDMSRTNPANITRMKRGMIMDLLHGWELSDMWFMITRYTFSCLKAIHKANGITSQVTKNYGVNQHQSKRYPDEDAGNPYESLGGSNAKPAFPLTPAAIINGAVMSRDDMARMEEEEEVARIRSNIGSKTVSSALLQVLMP